MLPSTFLHVDEQTRRVGEQQKRASRGASRRVHVNTRTVKRVRENVEFLVQKRNEDAEVARAPVSKESRTQGWVAQPK